MLLDLYQFYTLDTLSDGQDQQWLVCELELPTNSLAVESPDADAVQADLRSLQQHTLC